MAGYAPQTWVAGERMRLSCAPFAASVTDNAWVVGAILAIVMVASLAFAGKTIGAEITMGAAVLAGVVVIAAKFAAARAERAERTWAMDLPFVLEEWFERLDEDPVEHASAIVLDLTFANEQPDPTAVVARFSGDGAEWVFANTISHFTVKRMAGFDQGKSASPELRRWGHMFVAEQLLPLHRERPLKTVTIRAALAG